MVTNKQEFERLYQTTIDEFKTKVIDRRDGQFERICQCCELDKPIHFLINNSTQQRQRLIDKGTHYNLTFPCFGANPKVYNNDFGWILDHDSIMYVERPYQKRLLKLICQLIPDHDVWTDGNDICIDNYKLGPSYACGPKLAGAAANKSACYVQLVRWSDPEALDRIFGADANHKARIQGEMKIGSLDMFIKNMTKYEFIEKLEKEQFELDYNPRLRKVVKSGLSNNIDW